MTSDAGTISRPNGDSATGTSFTFATAIGMPMIVIARKNAVMMRPSTEPAPAVGFFTTVRPKGRDCVADGEPEAG